LLDPKRTKPIDKHTNRKGSCIPPPVPLNDFSEMLYEMHGWMDVLLEDLEAAVMYAEHRFFFFFFCFVFGMEVLLLIACEC
jgi:hypothetical protein